MRVHRYLRGLLALATASVLAACGTSGPSASGTGDITVWAITGGYNAVFQNSLQAYDTKHGKHSQLQLFQSDTYKQKIQVTLGSGNPPDVFENWGGSGLSSLAQQNLVVDLSTTPGLKDRYLPSLLGSATFGGKLYGVPMNGISPGVIFYNKKIFAQNNLTPPKTFDDLLALVRTLKGKGVTPFALGGAQRWPQLMFEEYLIDRVGGDQVIDNILNRVPGAWSDPAVLRANQLITQLLGEGAFEDGFSSVSYDTGQSTALLYTGKAGMQLMGAWDYASIKKAAPDFVQNGDLGWFPFPTVAGGGGDPSNLEGNPANYYSVSAKSKSVPDALAFLQENVMTPTYINDMLSAGRTPPVPGIRDQLASRPDAPWNTFVYDLAQNAHHYALSWDQALPPGQADTMLTELSKLFLGQSTPQQFSAAMDKAAA